MTMNELEDIAVKKAIEQLGLKPGKNGDAAVPAGSKQKVVEAQKQPEPVKPKKIMVELTVAQEARAIREAHIKGITVKEYIQETLNETLTADIGKPLINGSTWMSGGGGKKVMAPTNSFGRDV